MSYLEDMFTASNKAQNEIQNAQSYKIHSMYFTGAYLDKILTYYLNKGKVLAALVNEESLLLR